LPRYVRGKRGVVVHFYGIHELQDAMPPGVAAPPQPVYAVRFDAEELNGHFLTRNRVEALASRLLSLPYEEIRQIPQVHDQRADIISAGSLILRVALERFGCPGLIVSTRGIRYGLLLRALSL